jgi:hypothetical protein
MTIGFRLDNRQSPPAPAAERQGSYLLSVGAGVALRVPAAPPTAKGVTVETAEH